MCAEATAKTANFMKLELGGDATVVFKTVRGERDSCRNLKSSMTVRGAYSDMQISVACCLCGKLSLGLKKFIG